MEKPGEAHSILIVDDEPEQREMLAELLATEGYRAEGVASGPEALGRARRDPPDLIVLDVAMSDMDGFEVCRHLKADARTAAVPILFVSGLSALQDKEQGLLAGAEDYVTKPVDPTDFLARVRALLRVRHLSLELDRTLAYLQEMDAARRAAGGAIADRGMESGGRRQPTAGGTAAAPGHAAHVLLVDDDRLIRDLYGKVLEEAGYRVTAVGGAAEAYGAVAGGVDVVLLDVMMPEISGLEALGRLREMAPDVPILILTAHQTAQNAIAALRGGAFDFIIKGMRPEVLLKSVARAVDRHRLALENRRLLKELESRLEANLH